MAMMLCVPVHAQENGASIDKPVVEQGTQPLVGAGSTTTDRVAPSEKPVSDSVAAEEPAKLAPAEAGVSGTEQPSGEGTSPLPALGTATEGETSGDAAAVGNPVVAPENRAEEKAAEKAAPPPAFLDDPAGAISHMLAPPERRADLPHDLSPWGMFMAADLVVKAVMIGLAFASLVTWTVWLAKSLELAGARARANRTLTAIRASKTLDEAVQRINGRGGPAALMLRAAKEEAELSDAAIDHAGGGGLKERVSAALGRIEAYAGRRMSKGTGVLATIGSTAPFVGLFGTVWGIMNAFIGISEAQTTNLAVVAPGIAEALLATALGLVAAIPAVVIYNVFARSITGYRQLLADAAVGVERLVSRDLDFRKMPGDSAASPAPALAAE